MKTEHTAELNGAANETALPGLQGLESEFALSFNLLLLYSFIFFYLIPT